MKPRFLFIALIAVLLLSACASAAGNGAQDMASADMKMAPLSEMPAEVQRASSTVQTAYRYAAANPDVLKEVPCYCGCGAMGHTSNYSCYVQSDQDGQILFDQHALGCTICVDITQDTMRMLGEGHTLQEIKASIDSTYSKYGPSNMTP